MVLDAVRCGTSCLWSEKLPAGRLEMVGPSADFVQVWQRVLGKVPAVRMVQRSCNVTIDHAWSDQCRCGLMVRVELQRTSNDGAINSSASPDFLSSIFLDVDN